jgi:superfamily II DNA or RNA helicase
MADEPVPGVHEALITDQLLERLAALRDQGWLIEWKELEDAALPDVIARHIHDRVRQAIAGIPSSHPHRRQEQIEIANRLLRVLAGGESSGDPIDPEARLLLELKRPIEPPQVFQPTPRPGIPFRDSALLVNAHRDLQIGHQVALEIQSADRIDLLCAFVRFAGVRLIRAELQEFLLRGGQMRVIASVYTGSTERRALDELVGLGAKVKVSFETSQTRLHAKAWLFERESGYHTAYVGSSNLTHSALLDGLEWNVRATQIDNPRIIERIAATFEQYWNEPEFESYDPHIDGQRLQDALDAQSGSGTGASTTSPRIQIDVAPKPFQVDILEALSTERQRGHFRNLVVAPTGTGKTWVSAFDYKRLRAAGFERLLFVAHRDEILRQSQEVYRVVLGDPNFGERHVGAERPVVGTHVFASIQSLSGRVDQIRPDGFDVVIVDEFHHAEAPTYRRLLQRLTPRVLVGLTATPERADGREILHWFDDRIGSEMRLWEALDQGLLCPFHYLGVSDGTDLRGVGFERGRYVTAELEDVLTGDHVRARRVIEAVSEWVLDASRMRALGFCAGVKHARFMAEQFTAAGHPSIALDGSTNKETRIQAVEQLRRGELRAIFTVDIFNEGVDIPEVDTILLLRPTESATVFLQQLGRGLRWAEGKSVLTVLDFVGQAHAEYRFDIRYRALIGGTRQQIAQQIEAGFPLMPPGCAIRLDEIAQRIVLDNVRSQIRTTRRAIVDDLRGMPAATTLAAFLEASAFDLPDIYSSRGVTFASTRRAAGHVRSAPTAAEGEMGRTLATLLHVDDEERYQAWRSWLMSAGPPAVASSESREGRLQLMLFAALGFRDRPVAELSDALDQFWKAKEARSELVELLDVLRDRARLETQPIDPLGIVPIHSHATYALYEIIAAYGLVSSGKLSETREGVKWAESAQSDLFFITLNKSEEDYSPTTRYADYPISPTRFHWESQSKTSQASAIGQRYIHHVARGSRVIMFVRENRRDERDMSPPYLCLGPARHVSHESDRPVKIVWELERPMPAEIYQRTKLAAG